MLRITAMGGIRNYLRKFATANGSEVIFPWYPEADTSSPEMQLVARTRFEPESPVFIKYPLAFVLWTALSTVVAMKSCRKEGELFAKLKRTVVRWFAGFRISPANFLPGVSLGSFSAAGLIE